MKNHMSSRVAWVCFLSLNLLHCGTTAIDDPEDGRDAAFATSGAADGLATEGSAVACAALRVANEATLETAVRRLLSDDAERLALARAAKAVADAHRGVVDRIVEKLAPYRARLSGAPPA